MADSSSSQLETNSGVSPYLHVLPDEERTYEKIPGDDEDLFSMHTVLNTAPTLGTGGTITVTPVSSPRDIADSANSPEQVKAKSKVPRPENSIGYERPREVISPLTGSNNQTGGGEDEYEGPYFESSITTPMSETSLVPVTNSSAPLTYHTEQLTPAQGFGEGSPEYEGPMIIQHDCAGKNLPSDPYPIVRTNSDEHPESPLPPRPGAVTGTCA